MKKLFFTLFGVAMAFSSSWAQEEIEYTKLEDLTSMITNADFTAGTPVNAIVKTYAKDLTDAGLGAGGTGVFGMQPVEGWTASAPTDNIMTTEDNGLNARACGVMSYIFDGDVAEYGLGGAGYVPYTAVGGPTCGLGVLAVWGATAQYTQEITLPAGAYLIEIPVCNTLGEGGMTSLNGFIAEDGTRYLSKKNSFAPDEYTSTVDQIAFVLDKETKGVISLGYISGGQGSDKSPHLFYSNVSLYKIDPAPIIAEKIAKAKETLLDVINNGEQIGVSTSDAQRVYDNANATLEEVEAAIEAQKAINESSLSDLSEFFIKNPHFNQDEPLPAGEGITTYAKDRKNNGVSYYGMLPVKGWVASNPCGEYDIEKTSGSAPNDGRACGIFGIGTTTWLGGSQFIAPRAMSDGATSGNVLGFLTCWGATTQYTQDVTIPAGKYTLTISYYNTGGTGEVEKNLMGFITSDGTEYLSEIKSFQVGSWQKMTITFELEESTSGKFSVGYQAKNVGSGSMPHFFIDGIALNYVGETAIDPSLFALQAAVASGSDLLESEKLYSELREKLEGLVESGRELVNVVSSDKELNTTVKDAIISISAEVKENVEAYERIEGFYEELETIVNEYNGKTLFAELHSDLTSLMNLIGDEVLSEYIWSTKQINDAIASVPEKIKAATQKAFETIQAGGYTGEDVEITSLIDGLSYTYSENAVTGNNIPDKEWTSDAGDRFKTQYGTAEVWNKSPFKVTRTLKDMPAGTYTITTRAFYRLENNDDNYNNYNSGTNQDLAFLWAGHSKTPLCNVAALAGLDKNIGSKLTNELTIPNNQKEANYVFTNEQFDIYTVKSVKTVLTETGDLSFGICSDEMSSDSWVVWYSFEIDYNNTYDESILAVELENYADETDNKLKSEERVVGYALIEEVEAAVNEAKNAVSNGTGLVEALQKLTKANEAYEENIVAYNNLYETLQKLYSATETYGKTAEQAAKDVATIVTLDMRKAYENRNYSTEQINALLAEGRAAIRELKIPAGMSAATDADPVICTSMIENPSFETGDFTGWTYNTAATGDTKIVGTTDGDYTVENAEGSYLFNTWNGSAVDFYVTQTVADLKPGTYELTALVASDKGNKITVSVNNEAVEAEMLEEKNYGTDVSVIFAVAEGEDAVIKVSSASWFKADDFRLLYFGTNSTKTPNAIEEVATDASASAIFNVAGVRQNALKKGINIVKNGNTVKKIYVK